MADQIRSRRRRLTACALTALFAASACGSGTAQVTAPSPSTSATQPATAPPRPSSSTSSSSTGATTGTGPPASGRAGTAFPSAQWDTTDPVAAGLDPVKLDEIAQRAKDGGSSCLAVIRDGKLVKDWYWNDTTPSSTQEVFSATKSYTSTLVGIAQAEGKLDINDRASKHLPEWAGTPSDPVTVKNLLSNNSGRHWDATSDYVTMTREANKTAYGVSLGQDGPPGSVWAYNNAAIQTLSGVLKKATGEEAAAYAERKLFEPIGMTDSEIRQDPSGGTLTYIGLSSTCRDMARFGHLILNKGNWNGRQVVPAAYVEEATGRSSQELNAAYGYLWWLNRKGRLTSPMQPTTGETGADRPDSQMVPGAPEDMFWALGLGNQIIQVDPGTNTVVVRIGPVNVPKGARPFAQKDTAEVVTQAITKK